MSLVKGLERFKDRTLDKIDRVTFGTLQEAGDRVIVLSPIGDPTLWMKAPPADYRPGFFVSNWFYTEGLHSPRTHTRYNIREVNGLDGMEPKAGGKKHYIGNSVEYGPALEYGHSSQAPAGIVGVIAIELPSIAEAQARRFA